MLAYIFRSLWLQSLHPPATVRRRLYVTQQQVLYMVSCLLRWCIAVSVQTYFDLYLQALCLLLSVGLSSLMAGDCSCLLHGAMKPVVSFGTVAICLCLYDGLNPGAGTELGGATNKGCCIVLQT